MKIVLILILTICNLSIQAQPTKKAPTAIVDLSNATVYVGKIKQKGSGKPVNGPITDTIAITNLKQKKELALLIKQIHQNGTEDISKCFIPRDAITIYKKEKPYCTILICFECDGLRINYAKEEDTPLPAASTNTTIRQQQMIRLQNILTKARKKTTT